MTLKFASRRRYTLNAIPLFCRCVADSFCQQLLFKFRFIHWVIKTSSALNLKQAS